MTTHAIRTIPNRTAGRWSADLTRTACAGGGSLEWVEADSFEAVESSAKVRCQSRELRQQRGGGLPGSKLQRACRGFWQRNRTRAFRLLSSSAVWTATLAIAALYIGSTVLTPLYPLYREAFGFSERTVTVIYAVYAVGNLSVLFFFGRLSDQVGRRAAACLAFGLTLLSALLFLFAQSTVWLLAARAVNGFAAGLGAAALTAWIAELEPSGNRARAAIVASSGNLAGLAFGGALCGLLAQYAPAPLRTVFVIYAAGLIIMLWLLTRVPETIREPASSLRSLDLKPRLGVPRNLRVQFVAPACMAFAAFALGGFFSSLTPGMLTEEMHLSNVAIIGAVVTLFFAVAALSAALSKGLASWTAMFAGATLIFPAVSLLIWAERATSLMLLLLASMLAGAAMAFSYRGSLQVLNEIAPQERRAELVSTYLLMCYLGNSLPVLGVGLLSGSLEPPTAHAIFAAVVAGLAAAAITVGVYGRHQQKRQTSSKPRHVTEAARYSERTQH